MQFLKKWPFPKLASKFAVETWFIKVDAWFELNGFGVRKEQQKYTALIAHAEDYVLDQVHSMVLAPPNTAPYTTIKAAILEKFRDSAMSRLEQLTTGIQLGDGKPSHLLNQLRRTNATTDDTIVRNFWIKRLPPPVRAVIAGMLQAAPETPLDALANTADAVLDSMNDPVSSSTSVASSAMVNAISGPDERIKKLEKQAEQHNETLQKINDKLSQLLADNRGRQRSRDRSQSRSRRSYTPQRSANEQQASPTCWFHREYGTQARKCLEPCDFNASTKN